MRKKKAPQMLANALIELSAKKDVDKITVREIVAQCGLSSQTFYNHFSDKYALILWIYKSEGAKRMEQFEAGTCSFREVIRRNLEFFEKNSDFLVNALENTHRQDSFWRQSSESAIEGLELHLKRKFNLTELSERESCHLRMYMYACTEANFWWTKNGKPVSIDELTEYIYEAIPETLKQYLK